MKRIIFVIAVSFFVMSGCVTAGEKTLPQQQAPQTSVSDAESSIIRGRIDALTNEIKDANAVLMSTEAGKKLEAIVKQYNDALKSTQQTPEGQAVIKLTNELNYWKGALKK
jgi:cell division FtsZ-interacting protein ZapD